MDFLLLAIALLLLLLAGLGLSLLLLPKRLIGAAELFALSFLFGSTIISMSSFLLGFLVSGALLRWGVALLCMAIGLIGIWRRGLKLQSDNLNGSAKWLLLVLAVGQTAVVGWLSCVRVLGWDGLFNFEVKARLTFLNGGVIPLDYFSDPSRTWTLQSYPLLLPLTESWLYLWLGRADQQLVKIIFLLFFIAALCLLNVGNHLQGVASWRRLIAPLLIFATPLLVVGDGSASSGYADFPLAVFYLAAVIYLADFWQSGSLSALRTAAALAACGCWLKQEGAVLWICLMTMAAVKIALKSTGKHAWTELAKAALPGLLVVAGWQLFVRFFSLPEVSQFSPINFVTLRGNLWRAPVIAESVLRELVNWRHWGLLWLIALAAVVRLAWRRAWSETPLSFAVLLPLAFYSGIYVFSLWSSFITHLESSFPRLLIHLSLVAVLCVSFATRLKPKSNPLGNHT